MGAISSKGRDVFRDHNTAGMPASGDRDPPKSEVREWADVIDAAVTGLVPEDVAGTSRTLTEADNGKYLNCTAATLVTITVPHDLPDTFGCLFGQGGLGQLTFVGSGGADIRSRSGYKKTETQEVMVSLVRLPTAGAFRLSGPLVA